MKRSLYCTAFASVVTLVGLSAPALMAQHRVGAEVGWLRSNVEPRSSRSNPLPLQVEEEDDGPSAAVTFAGFQALDEGRYRVFVRLTSEPALHVERAGKLVTYTLEDSRVLLRNNKNPLDASHFRSPLLKARLKEQDGDVLLVMNFRSTVRPDHRFLRRSDGSVTLQVDF